MAKVLFCQKLFFAYFGTMSISAFIKKYGHAVELVIDADADKVVEEVLVIQPDMVAFSTLTATGEFEWAVEVARKLKRRKPKLLTVFGGIHPTLFPEQTMKNKAIDVLCRGEGEYAMLELCNLFDKRRSFDRIQNLWVRTSRGMVKNHLRQLVNNLNELPFPNRDLYQKYGYFNNPDSVDVIAGRGCPFNCSFCYNHVFRKLYRGKGKFVRKYAVDRIIAELEEVKRKYSPKLLSFSDDLFVLDKKWLREFTKKYRERIALPFKCTVRADMLDDETALMLADAGASVVCFGLETGNEKLRNELLKKGVTNAQTERAARILHSHGIKFVTTNMVGLPGETIDNAFETIELNQRIRANYVWCAVFQPYPEMEITKNMNAMGCPPLDPAKYYTTCFKGSLLKQDNINQLVNIHKLFYPAFKLPWLKPLIRQIIKLPPNLIFDLVFMLGFGWFQFSCAHRNSLQILGMGLRNLKVFYSKNLGLKKSGKS